MEHSTTDWFVYTAVAVLAFYCFIFFPLTLIIKKKCQAGADNLLHCIQDVVADFLICDGVTDEFLNKHPEVCDDDGRLDKKKIRRFLDFMIIADRHIRKPMGFHFTLHFNIDINTSKNIQNVLIAMIYKEFIDSTENFIGSISRKIPSVLDVKYNKVIGGVSIKGNSNNGSVSDIEQVLEDFDKLFFEISNEIFKYHDPDTYTEHFFNYNNKLSCFFKNRNVLLNIVNAK